MTTQEILEGIERGKYKIDCLDVYAVIGKFAEIDKYKYNEHKDELFAQAIKDALLKRKSAQFKSHKIVKKETETGEDIEVIRFYFVVKAGGKANDS
ncbi:MAG: hypothetical protein J6N15_04155 [Ruminiclostridium sp.]|nr:hypothetical protein [Ruminiclostridium sp.]